MNTSRATLLCLVLIAMLVGAGAALPGLYDETSSSDALSHVKEGPECGGVPVAEPSELCEGPVLLDRGIPIDIAGDPASLDADTVSRMVDCFAWETFAALNWPGSSQCRGTPASDPWAATDWTSDRVWETYKAPYELFQSTDSDWNPKDISFDDPAPSGACGELADNRPPGSSSPTLQNLVYEDFQAGLPDTVLTDQQGNTVWYEITFNRDVFEYIRDTGLAATGTYDYGGPLVGREHVDFPTPDNGASGAGAIEIKAAWRIMTSDDDTSRYYTQEAVIYDDLDSSCTTETVGLVGLHIARKLESSPRWIWATFEHEDNVPPAGTFGDGRDYNFFSLACAEDTPEDCAGQTAVSDTEYACCPNLIPYPDPFDAQSNQVTRLVPIPANREINDKFRDAYADAGSPFQYYMLVGAQWARPHGEQPAAWERPCNPNGPWGVDPPAEGVPCYEQIPEPLRNTSMETLIVQTDENGIQYSSDSCMNCHQVGGIDGSYLWQDAMMNQYEISSD